jgi:hypothetical protein
VDPPLGRREVEQLVVARPEQDADLAGRRAEHAHQQPGDVPADRLGPLAREHLGLARHVRGLGRRL